VGDGERARVVRGGGEVRRLLEATEEVRLLEDHAGGAVGGRAKLVGVGDAVPVRHVDDLEPEARSVGADDLAHLRVERLREDDLGPARGVLRDVAGVRRDGGPVVPGGVRDVHARELADDRLVLEERLEHALAHLGLVRRVGGQELAPLEDRVDHCRDVVVVHTGAEERDLLAGGCVAGGERFQPPNDLLLGERLVEVQLAVEADPRRDVAEQLLDGRDPDRLEHLLPIRVSQRDVGHCSATTSR
jgi:hypothetical protein